MDVSRQSTKQNRIRYSNEMQMPQINCAKFMYTKSNRNDSLAIDMIKKWNQRKRAINSKTKRKQETIVTIANQLN